MELHARARGQLNHVRHAWSSPQRTVGFDCVARKHRWRSLGAGWTLLAPMRGRALLSRVPEACQVPPLRDVILRADFETWYLNWPERADPSRWAAKRQRIVQPSRDPREPGRCSAHSPARDRQATRAKDSWAPGCGAYVPLAQTRIWSDRDQISCAYRCIRGWLWLVRA